MLVIFLRLTYYGWGFVVLLLFSAFLTTSIVKRFGKKERAGCVTWGYIFVILFSLNLFACFLSLALLEKSSTFFTGKKYTATVVRVESYLSTSTDKDGRSSTTRMYTPVVTFTTLSGQQVTKVDNVSSSESPAIGNKITVIYDEKKDELQELSFANIGLLAAGLFFSFISALLIIGATRYAFNKDVKPIFNLLLKVLLWFVFPIAMLLMATGLGWYVYQRCMHGYKSDQPVWVLGICIFFTIMLVFGFVGYAKVILVSKKRKAI